MAQATAPTPTQRAGRLIANACLQRSAATDLEIAGALAGLSPGSTRYLTRADLLTLPQRTLTATGDPNFAGPTTVSGVLLEDLVRELAAAADTISQLRSAATFTAPTTCPPTSPTTIPCWFLRSTANLPNAGRRTPKAHGRDMGPYMISHQQFKSGFKILAHEDEPQIPWGVVRLESRDEKEVLAAIAPCSKNAAQAAVEAG